MNVFRAKLSACGITRLWAFGRSEYGVCLIGGNSPYNTCAGLLITALKRRSSAAAYNSSTSWTESAKYPARTNRRIVVWSRDRSPCPTNPHQAGDAYSNLATVVALVTSCIIGPFSPWAPKTRSAYIDCLAFELMLLTCWSKLRCSDMVTPSIFILSTLMRPGFLLGSHAPSFFLGRLTITCCCFHRRRLLVKGTGARILFPWFRDRTIPSPILLKGRFILYRHCA